MGLEWAGSVRWEVAWLCELGRLKLREFARFVFRLWVSLHRFVCLEGFLC